jgi:hypothetical protein
MIWRLSDCYIGVISELCVNWLRGQDLNLRHEDDLQEPPKGINHTIAVPQLLTAAVTLGSRDRLQIESSTTSVA